MLPALFKVIPKCFVVVAEANAASLKGKSKKAKKAKHRNYTYFSVIVFNLLVFR